MLNGGGEILSELFRVSGKKKQHSGDTESLDGADNRTDIDQIKVHSKISLIIIGLVAFAHFWIGSKFISCHPTLLAQKGCVIPKKKKLFLPSTHKNLFFFRDLRKNLFN